MQQTIHITKYRIHSMTEAVVIIREDLSSIGDHNISEFKFDLPRSLLNSPDIIELNNLAPVPSSDECDMLSKDNNGSRLKLNDMQLKILGETGRVHVKSANFRDQEHIWQISKILQKGTRNIWQSFLDDIAIACNQIYMIPDRIYRGVKVNIKGAFQNIWSSITELLDLFIGLKGMGREYSDYEIQCKLAEYRRNKVVCESIEKGYTISDIISNKSEIFDKLREPLDKLSVVWNMESTRRREELYDSNLPKEENAKIILEIEREQYQRNIFSIVAGNLDERDSKLVERLMKAMMVYDFHINEWSSNNKKAVSSYMRSIHDNHPILSRIPGFVVNKEKEFMERYEHEYPYREVYGKISKDLTNQEKVLFDRNYEIMNSGEYNDLKVMLESRRVPKKSFKWNFKIWRASNWEITKHDDCYYSRYTVKKETTLVTSTRYPFWRFYNILIGVYYLFMNINYFIFMNLVYGKFGFRSLYGLDKFYANVVFNSATGQLEPTSETNTWFSRVASLWYNISESRGEFESQPDTGILGKSFSRVFNLIWNYLVKGFISTPASFICHPILSVINIILSLALMLSCPLLAPLASILRYLFDIGIYDTTSISDGYNIFRVFNILIWRFLIKGCGQFAVSIIAILAHLVLAIILCVWAHLSNGLRYLYDSVIYGIVLRYRARVPSRDGFLVKRIQGPGLSSNYYYLVDSDLALILLQRKLEAMELKIYISQKEGEIDGPLNKLMGYYRNFLDCGLRPDCALNPIKRFNETKQLLHNRLGAVVRKHEENYKLNKELRSSSRIKMANSNLQVAIESGSELCRKFVVNRILPRLPKMEQQNEFWKSIDVTPNNWSEMVIKSYCNIFNNTITIPIEDVDTNGFHIEIKTERIKDLIVKLLGGKLDDGFGLGINAYKLPSMVYNLPKVTDGAMTPSRTLNDSRVEMMIIDKSMVEQYMKHQYASSSSDYLLKIIVDE
jgi:hypothetical protein